MEEAKYSASSVLYTGKMTPVRVTDFGNISFP
jgi:hypothetical protein